MYQDKVTLCGSNAYEKKYYLNPDFNGLPEQIKQELQIACVLFTAEVGGILTLEFDEDRKNRISGSPWNYIIEYSFWGKMRYKLCY